MKKAQSTIKKGFSLVEIILAGSIFALIITGMVGALIYSQESATLAGARERAAFLAEEGLEAVRNIRDQNFANLTDGSHGLVVSGNQWSLSGTQDITDEFTRQVVISTINANTKSVTSNVSWQQNPQRTGLISLATQFTNWAIIVGNQADNLAVDVTNAHLENGNRNLAGITLENTGTADITIDRITVSWIDEKARIEEISIGGIVVWSQRGPGSPKGRQRSGVQLDIQDFTLAAGSGVINIDYFGFNRDMSGNAFNVVFTMIDGSQKTVSGIQP